MSCLCMCAYVCTFVSRRVCLLCDSTFLLLLLLLLLQFILLLQVDVGRLHSDDGFVQKTEGFLHMFGLDLETYRGMTMVTILHHVIWSS